MKNNWIKLFIAAILEVAWVIGLAHAYNFWTWIGTVILIILSNWLMIQVAQILPTGTVYTVFVGLGAGGTVFVDIIFFNEPFNLTKILLVGVLLIGVIGLKIITENKSAKKAERS